MESHKNGVLVIRMPERTGKKLLSSLYQKYNTEDSCLLTFSPLIICKKMAKNNVEVYPADKYWCITNKSVAVIDDVLFHSEPVNCLTYDLLEMITAKFNKVIIFETFGMKGDFEPITYNNDVVVKSFSVEKCFGEQEVKDRLSRFVSLIPSKKMNFKEWFTQEKEN
jgi:hypothetical protein